MDSSSKEKSQPVDKWNGDASHVLKGAAAKTLKGLKIKCQLRSSKNLAKLDGTIRSVQVLI